MRLHGASSVGTQSTGAEDKILDEQSLKNLDQIRRIFTAEVGQFRWGNGHNGKKVKQVLLKEIKIEGFGKIGATSTMV